MTDPLISQLQGLTTEQRNPRTMDIDLLPSLDIVQRINQDDQLVAKAVEQVLPRVAEAVDRIVASFRAGGRLIYIGAGTSGRLGVLDAVECPPTYGVSPEQVMGLMAGGDQAMWRAKEGAEDDPALAVADLQAINFQARDTLVGIAASGRTPYVIGGLAHARTLGASTVAVSCNPGSPIGQVADIDIAPVVGPEVLSGSTRMKAGTAQKLVLNMLSTASMIRSGKSYQNLMIDLNASNEKLVARATRILMELTDLDAAAARQLLEQTGFDVKLALMVAMTDLSPEQARRALDAADGFLRRAVAKAKGV